MTTFKPKYSWFDKLIMLGTPVMATIVALAQFLNVTAVALTGGTAANVVSGRYVVDEMTFINSNTTNVAILKFYDAASAITNIVRPAYDSIGSYQTNYTVVTTNAAGLLNTNVFTTQYSYVISNAAITNERVKLATVAVPANTTRTLPTKFIVANGLTVLSDQSGTLEVTYRGN